MELRKDTAGAQRLLQERGIRPGTLRVDAIDTYRDPTFFSARREGVQCGRNINSIKIL